MDGKKKLEVKFKKTEEGKVVKAIFIDDVMLDYSVDVEALNKISALGIEYKKAALLDIERHFIECVCDMVGRQVTAQELDKAFRTGWI
jgi:hypothetical protein